MSVVINDTLLGLTCWSSSKNLGRTRVKLITDNNVCKYVFLQTK